LEYYTSLIVAPLIYDRSLVMGWRGQRKWCLLSVIGNVCMDMTMIEVHQGEVRRRKLVIILEADNRWQQNQRFPYTKF
jgi:alanine racemase